MRQSKFMNDNLAAAAWTTARGEKWRAQADGMEAMLIPVNEPLIRALRLDAPYRIAEIGCGGGGTTLDILRSAPKGSAVHGFDISPALIELARVRLSRNEHAIDFHTADMATAAPEQLYDRLVSRFAVMFFDDAPAAFANLFRWLAPGGRFAFAVWGPTTENPWMTSVRDVVANVVAIPKADPGAPGPFRYAESGKLVALLDQAGFRELNVEDWRGMLSIGGGLPPVEAANFALASFSSFAELLADAGGDALNAARRSLTTVFSNHQQDDIVRLDASVYIVTGMRSRQ
jgi:SAM-dependent methyltransferase